MGFRSFDTCLARGLIQSPRRIASRRLGYAAAEAGRLADAIRATLVEDVPDISSNDIRYGLSNFLESCSGFWEWHYELLSREQIEIQWREEQPRISVPSLLSWVRLCNTFDEDTLLAFDFARRFSDDEPVHRMLRNWRTVARSGDRELRVLLAQGTTDLHIHASGVRMPQAAWLQIMARPGGYSAFTNLDAKYARRQQPPDGLSKHAATSFAERMKRARRLRASLIERCGLADRAADPAHPSGMEHVWHASKLSVERNLLIRCWRRIAEEGDPSFAEDFDHYLALKHEFFSLTRQHAFSGDVGLRFFDREHFGSLKKQAFPEGSNLGRAAAMRSNARHEMAPLMNAGAFVCETDHLSRAELRIAPFARAPDYWRFFTLWDKLYAEFSKWLRAEGRTPPTIGFCIHFKRSRGDDVPAGCSTDQLLRQLDRATAALRAAMSCPIRAPRLGRLVRIDVAGNERDSASALFGLHLRLLRAEPEALHYCESLWAKGEQTPASKYLSCWRRLAETGRHKPRLSEAPLGLTVHAGEDFTHPIEGLYQIAGAVESCGLSSGDSIGHGLALSTAYAERQRASVAYIEQGMQFDALCWLHSLVKAGEDSDAKAELPLLERLINRLGRRIFGEEASAADIDASDFVEVWRRTFRPQAESKGRSASPAVARLAAIVLSADVLAQRERALRVDEWIDLKRYEAKARQVMIDEIINRRIIVETNPSSNLRVSGAMEAGENPVIDILSLVRDGLVASINTDNPGVFVTCIENEYAFLLASARKAGIPEGQARKLLAEMRYAGEALVRWPGMLTRQANAPRG